jgi:hypothetical protein
MKDFYHFVAGLCVDSVRVWVLGKYWAWFIVTLFSAPALGFLQMWALYLSWALLNPPENTEENPDILKLCGLSLIRSSIYLVLGWIVAGLI